MVNIQEWINSKCPTWTEKSQIQELYLDEPQLEGTLDLTNFARLEEVYISSQVDETKITFKNISEKLEIIKLPNAQKVFDREFPLNGSCLGEYDRKEEKDSDGEIVKTKVLINRGQTRAEIKEINLADEGLEGVLIIKDFPQLEAIDLSENNLTSLEFINCPNLKEIYCENNNLNEIPSGIKSEVLITLIISHNQLLGSLNLNDFKNLEHLSCSGNEIMTLKLDNLPSLTQLYSYECQLNKLVINNCPKIVIISVWDNKLTNFDFDSLNPKALTQLFIADNNFSRQDLSVFRKFTNLTELDLGTNNKKILNQGIYNKFYGSLKCLQNAKNLVNLDIRSTDVEHDLEYLPLKVKTIHCDSLKKNSSCLKIEKKLKEYAFHKKVLSIYGHKYKNYDFEAWKEDQIPFKMLKNTWEKHNPNTSFWDFLHLINVSYFQIYNGAYSIDNLKETLTGIRRLFSNQEKEKEIDYLELRIQELTNFIEKQWNKVYQAYLYCVSDPKEKQLLDQLIKTQIELTKFKKQSLGLTDYRKKCREYENNCREIEDKLEELLLEKNDLKEEVVEKALNKIKCILTECEEIANWQLELEEKINAKKLLLRGQMKLQELEFLKQQNSLIIKDLKEIKTSVQPKETFLIQLINNLKGKRILTEQEQEIISKINELLGIKQMFLNTREQTISSLRQCCDILEAANIGKYAKREEISKAISAAGKLVSRWTVVNIVEPVGDGASVANSRKKRKFAIENSQIFQQSLTEEEKSLALFNNTYNSLLNSLASLNLTEEKVPVLFTLRYRTYEVATNIWANKAHITESDMKDAISLLATNLLDLQEELKTQEQSLKNITEQLQNQSQALVVQQTSQGRF